MIQASNQAKWALRVLYVMAGYVFLQLAWWGYLLVDLNFKYAEFATIAFGIDQSDHVQSKTWMVIGEGSVFFALLAAGFIYIHRTVRRELRRSRAQQNFLLAITHELKTPVAAIKLVNDTLQKRKLDEEQRAEMLSHAVSETKRLESLVENILLAAQLDHAALKPQNEKIDFSALVESEIQRFERNTGCPVQRQIQPGLTIRGEAPWWRMVMQNLLDNARKYSTETPVIGVVLRGDQELELNVSDQGIGIDPAERIQIFQRFYRSQDEATRSVKGTGLGLFLVRSVVEAHGGIVRTIPNEPHGSQFIVQLKTK
ncbi:MAG: sensor histidine kinase [Flavobacteriales bacterium]